MHTLVGIFPARAVADRVFLLLKQAGISEKSINYLSPGHADTASVPTTDAEAEGMGKAVGGLVGGALGAGTGLALGSAVASVLVPGVGAVMAAGYGAAAVLGVGGVAAGATVGDAAEEALNVGVPADDIYFYRKLLKQGRSLIIVNVDSQAQADAAQNILEENGAPDVEAARRELKDAA
jgi:hypothetical protein